MWCVNEGKDSTTEFGCYDALYVTRRYPSISDEYPQLSQADFLNAHATPSSYGDRAYLGLSQRPGCALKEIGYLASIFIDQSAVFYKRGEGTEEGISSSAMLS